VQQASTTRVQGQQTAGRTKSIPVYPVILFVVAFLYLVGVMSWQVWKDHDYHLSQTSKMVQSRVVLYQDYYKAQVEPLERLLVEFYDQAFLDQSELDQFYLKATELSPWVKSAVLVDMSGGIFREAGIPLTLESGADKDVTFTFTSKTPVSGFRVLDENTSYLFHRRKNNQGYLLAVIEFDWFKDLLAKNNNPHAVFEVKDNLSGESLWEDLLPGADSIDKQRVWSGVLQGSRLELTGYINLSQIKSYYQRSMTPSALVVFFYLFGGVGLIWYLGTARRQNKSLQQENRELAFRGDLIFSSISDAVVVMGRNGNVLFANSAFFSLLKLDKGKDITSDSKLNNHLAFWQKLDEWSDRLLDAFTVKADDVLSIDSLAISRYVEPSHQMLSLDDDSQVVVWILKDVTDQHRIHEELITSQAHYKSTFEGAGVALAMVDLNELGELLASGSIVQWDDFARWRDRNSWQFRSMIDGMLITEVNESACRMLDTIDEMTAVKHLKKSVFHTDSVIWQAIIQLVLNNKEKAETLIDLHSVTGTSITAQVGVSLVKSQTANVKASDDSTKENRISGHILLSMLDVSALKQAKEKAAEREQFWQQVVHSVPDIVYVNDFSSRSNVFVNHEIGERLGYSTQEIEQLGERYWQKLVHPEDKVILKEELPKFRELENGMVKETVLRLQDKQGGWHSYLFRDTPFTRDENNKVKRYIGVARDITEILEAQTKVDKHERYLEVLAENIRDLVWVMDPEFHFKYISPSVRQVLGYQQDEILNQGVRSFLAEDQFSLIEQEIAGPLRAVMAGEINAESYRDEIGEHVVEVMALHQDGHYVSLEVKVGLLWDENNNFEGLLGSCRDITRRRKSQAELKLAAEVFESSNEAILITDMDGDIVRTNRAFKSVTGYEDSDLMGKNLSSLCTEQQTEQFYHTLLDGVSRSGYWQGEVWHRKKTGEPYPAWVGVSAIKSDDGFIESYIVIFSDMSERKEAEERIHRLAYYDPLTDLANRSLFMEQLRLEMRHADDNRGAVALIYLDLDNFKPVNDTLGHEAGDILLKEVALRLNSCVRSSDTVARMGGDEFTIILGDQKSAAKARSFGEHVASQVVSALQEPVAIQGQEFRVTASVGVAVYPEHGSDVSELLRNADKAMYLAKESGRDLYRLYEVDQ